ncbi:hypothetical protein [Actinoplanes couchii]|uniref:Uncharacterized protein n=1 Tax=Actinoplanes couchii TaxID=403638 RepID=A0ABQ3X6D2_9ACTN|nr:hypothetical protein [Actinoplanes couchii]MDR6325231.1 hypothetical protein [Actinoplanes couchii]GID54065.1 hypothetical protein Aco03nite_024690 [Actinoplanes couchii]
MRRRIGAGIVVAGAVGVVAVGSGLTASANWSVGTDSGVAITAGDRLPRVAEPKVVLTADGAPKISWRAVRFSSGAPVGGYAVFRHTRDDKASKNRDQSKAGGDRTKTDGDRTEETRGDQAETGGDQAESRADQTATGGNQSAGGGGGTEVCRVPAATLSCVDGSVRAGSTVAYTVRAVAGQRWSGPNGPLSDRITVPAEKTLDQATRKTEETTAQKRDPAQEKSAEPRKDSGSGTGDDGPQPSASVTPGPSAEPPAASPPAHSSPSPDSSSAESSGGGDV